MHFLCFHGLGTNAQIMEAQTAAIRYELGSRHTYAFVEGVIPTELAPELRGVATAGDEFFSYFDGQRLETCLGALDCLEAYLAAEGPFDGIMAFSQGAVLATTYLAHKIRQNPQSTPPFKCAVLFSSGSVFDAESLRHGTIRELSREVDGQVITIPTAHIWGANDTTVNSTIAQSICDSKQMDMFVHDGGHDIPGVGMDSAVKESVRIIRRAILRAECS